MIQNIKNFGLAVLFIAAMSVFAALVIETFNQIDMGFLYKELKDQTVKVDIEILADKRIVFDFYSDCGKFGTDEALSGYVLTADRLLGILQDIKNEYTDEEL